MPELPEVETIVSQLKKCVINKKIKDVVIFLPKVIKNTNPTNFKNALIGQTIIDVKRKGKHILFLTNHYCFINHLRMEGRFFINEKERRKNKHILLSFLLSNNKFLDYYDTRRFGTFHLHSIEDYNNKKLLLNLGLEPFSQELTVEYLQKQWKLKRKEIKQVLLEQNVIVGIGNIYACEILYDAKINPFIQTNQLSYDQLKRILTSTKKILKKAIKAGGSKTSTFVSVHNMDGKFQNQLKVYGRENKKCHHCDSMIKRVKQGGRSTYYCPKEQPNK